ncbi:alpha/beta hydrolase fold domain-containing protein [Sphingorhabdus sp.]|uniref:alpha/beta hydrolase fold domain-containing protein n=1 Tax=Sphingorhabdus sp. TaxID=1902408 RepID=UPI00391DC84E
MPSFAASLAGFVLRTTGYYRRMFTGGPQFQKNIAKVRAAPLPSPKAHVDLDIRQSEFQGRPVWHIAPKGRNPSAYVLFWHGGGYVYPATPIHWKFLSHMASQFGWSITAPLYPLAPENTAEHVTAWAMDYYATYQAEMGGKPFVMGGDSAGGGLTAALAQMARDSGQALPAGLLLICPWLNLDPAHPDQLTTEPRDGILTISGICEGGTLYAGDLQSTDPRCSPIFGNWEGLPPILAFAGGDDILVTDSRALKAKLPSVELIELSGMMHDWPIFSFAESRKAQLKMASFVTPAVT